MSSGHQTWELAVPIPAVEAEPQSWYAVQTKARHEKVIVQRFRELGLTTYLPTITETHRWSDRKKKVEVPLFSCYVFARLGPSLDEHVKACRVDGVFRIVGNRNEGLPIPDDQIDAIRVITEQHMQWSEHPFLKIGQHVRIRSGALTGVEGILVARNGDRTLVVSVDAIQRSLAVRIEGYDVEPL